MFGYSREAVRVKVKKCDGKTISELRKFSVDPQITSLEVLHSILVKAFDLKYEYLISYKTNDDFGNEIFIPILSDWDLDAAFLKAHNISVSQRCEPCVNLQIDTKTFTELANEWEPNLSQPCVTECAKEANQVTTSIENRSQSGFQGMFMNQMGKTLNMVTKALNFYEDPSLPPRPPLSDSEFRTFLDPVGKVVNVPKLRDVIYFGGIEPSLRKVVWKHILNVYPEGMTGKERMDYMRNKSAEYYQLRNKWKDCMQKGQISSDLAYVTTMVRKDVLRTDRHHPFYAGNDDNQNIACLFNILTTYALNHPQVSYCQGMSDLASPLLVTMTDEAHAYICLCALMARLYPNFMLDGNAMTLKFQHLTDALQTYDPEFYTYLKSHQADDLLFCYRWLLLEMKREFAFDDALRMLEVLWSSLPPKPPETELKLTVQEFDPLSKGDNAGTIPISPLLKTPRETAYTKLCAMRRQSSAFNINSAQNSGSKLKHVNYSLDENVTREVPDLKFAKEFQSLDDAAIRVSKKCIKSGEDSYNRVDKSVREDFCDDVFKGTNENIESKSEVIANGQSSSDNNTLGTQIRQLRNRISQHNNKFYASLEKLDAYISSIEKNESDEVPKVKLIKNLNEFLTFANRESCSKIKQNKFERKSSLAEGKSTEIPKSLVRTLSVNQNVQQLEESLEAKIETTETVNESNSPDDSQEYHTMTTSVTREIDFELEQLNKRIFGVSVESVDSKSKESETLEEAIVWENPIHIAEPVTPEVERLKSESLVTPVKHSREVLSSDSSYSESYDTDNDAKDPLLEAMTEEDKPRPIKFFSSMSQELENAKKNCELLLNSRQTPKLQSVAATLNNFQKKYEMLKSPNLNQRVGGTTHRTIAVVEDIPCTKWSVHSLPPPEEFGGGNPFLMFLCLTILLQHRDYIMRNRMDYNELAMHFDKMVRKHNVNRVLSQARQLYSAYLKQHPKLNDIST